jgi:hypothetical protein
VLNSAGKILIASAGCRFGGSVTIFGIFDASTNVDAPPGAKNTVGGIDGKPVGGALGAGDEWVGWLVGSKVGNKVGNGVTGARVGLDVEGVPEGAYVSMRFGSCC